jgi:2-polyprenyl-6-methoxyphenol hydroxylase-like FAD-dependent oxidoreductase
MPTFHDAIVVGAGPAGSTAAASLARRGRDVVLVDRASFRATNPAATAFRRGPVGILHDLGLRDGLGAAGFARVRAGPAGVGTRVAILPCPSIPDGKAHSF